MWKVTGKQPLPAQHESSSVVVIRQIPDITASAVEAIIAKIRKEENLGPQTANGYLQAAKQFCKWMMEDGRLTVSPLAHLKRANVRVDQRRVRRELTADEISRLLKATESGRICCKLSGPDRGMLYRVALSTGLRALELSGRRAPAAPDQRSPTDESQVGCSPGDRHRSRLRGVNAGHQIALPQIGPRER